MKGISSLSKTQLITKLLESKYPLPLIREDDLLVRLRPFYALIRGMAEGQSKSDREREFFKEKIILSIANSLSRLPCLAAKKDHSSRDWLAIKTIVLNMEALHGLLGTSPLCEVGKVMPYNPLLHEGPTGIEQGESCIPVSTGIQTGKDIIVKAIVERAKQ
jgi:hypothetical protein